MGAGILNLICATDIDEYLLIGNPCKTFFATTYKKHTNFGIFNKYIDPIVSSKISPSQKATYDFELYSPTNKENGDILLNTVLEISLPPIWSGITFDKNDEYWKTYEFQWISYLGALIIDEIEFKIGSTTVQKYTGEYLKIQAEKTYSASELEIFYKMIGHSKELYDPKSYHNGYYPNAHFSDSEIKAQAPYNIEPSIREQKLIIPLGLWYQHNLKKGLPFCALNDNTNIRISITFRGLNQWYRIRDGFSKTLLPSTTDDKVINGNYISPNSLGSNFHTEFHRFKQPPIDNTMNEDGMYDFSDRINEIDVRPRLIITGACISQDEINAIKRHPKKILLKEIIKEDKESFVKSHVHRLESKGLLTSFLFYFTRDDVSKRNEWTNYTNWEYINERPKELENITYTPLQNHPNGVHTNIPTNLKTTGSYQIENDKEILKSVRIQMNGKDREPELPNIVYGKMNSLQYLKKNIPEGVYYHNFELYPNDYDQPSGHMNGWNLDIDLILDIIEPKRNPLANQQTICTANGNIIETTSTQLYNYTYDLHLYLESYQELMILNGNVTLLKTSERA